MSNPDNQVFEIKSIAPEKGEDDKTIWLKVGTLTLFASKGHAQGMIRLNMFPSQNYHVFLKQEGFDGERG